MMQPASIPTEVASLIQDLFSGAKTILGDQFLGLYLHGSLATGDFNPRTSDIDFVVVTTSSLADEKVAALQELHARLLQVHPAWAYKLEGTYIPAREFRRYNPADGPYPCTHEGRFYLAGHESHWIIQRHILRNQGVVIAGPDPASLIDPVTAADLHDSIRGFLAEWWLPMLKDTARLAQPDYQFYAVLTMCRMLYTLANGEIASKPASARWVQSTFPQWSALAAWAVNGLDGSQGNKLDETILFIRFTAEQTQVLITN